MMCEERNYYNDTRDYANYALEKAVSRLHEEVLRYAQCKVLPEDYPQIAQAYAVCERLNLDILREIAEEVEKEENSNAVYECD